MLLDRVRIMSRRVQLEDEFSHAGDARLAPAPPK
jgi:hypothetical protein